MKFMMVVCSPDSLGCSGCGVHVHLCHPLLMQEPLNLLYHLFGQDRLQVISYPAGFADRIPPQLLEHSRCYELVCVKLQEANHAGAPFMRKQQDQLHVCYLQVAGPGMARTTAQSTLEKLCNFSTLSPGKV